MTRLPFAARARRGEAVVGPAALPTTVVRGSFRSPNGGTGRFRGVYRLEDLRARSGPVAARGVFTGELLDERGDRVGIAARRRTTTAELCASDGRLAVRIAAVDVDLNGLVVAVEGLLVDVQGTRCERAVRAALPPAPPPQARLGSGTVGLLR